MVDTMTKKYITQQEYDAIVRKHKYVPIDELMEMIDLAIRHNKLAYVKFICSYSGAEQTSDTPNIIHIRGYRCQECGEHSLPEKYGLMVIFGTKDATDAVKQFVKEM